MQEEKTLYALSIIRTLRIIADFAEVIGWAEKEGLKISEVLTGRAPQPAQWGEILMKLYERLTKEEFLEMMGIMFDLGRLTEFYALPAEEKIKCAKSIRRFVEFVEKVISG